MKQNLSIRFAKKPQPSGILSVRNITLRERIVRLLLGTPQKLTIIVPGNSVESVDIHEVTEGGGC